MHIYYSEEMKVCGVVNYITVSLQSVVVILAKERIHVGGNKPPAGALQFILSNHSDPLFILNFVWQYLVYRSASKCIQSGIAALI